MHQSTMEKNADLVELSRYYTKRYQIDVHILNY